MAATIKQIAELAGVAPTTVSLVLNGSPKIGDKTRAHVLKIADELDYYPNQSGRLLKQGKSNAIAVLSTFFQNIFKMEFVNGVERAVFEGQYELRQYLTAKGNEEQKTKEILFGKMADAVILLSTLPERSFMEKMRKARKPVILVEDVMEGFAGVSFDNTLGAYQAVEHLASTGRRKIAISIGLRAYMGHKFVDDRFKGYMTALRDLDIEYSNIIDLPEYTLESGRSIFHKLQDGGSMPDALFCASGDLTAAGFLQEALAHGLKVPDDIAVVGFDDSIIARSTTLGLTTIRQPVREMGLAAYELALSMIDNPDADASNRVLDIKPVLVVRQTA